VHIDISLNFFRRFLKDDSLELGKFGVGNFFYPEDDNQHERTTQLIEDTLKKYNMPLLAWRDVPISNAAINAASAKAQLPIKQVIFAQPKGTSDNDAFEKVIDSALLEMETVGYTDESMKGFYPMSFSSRTMVYKGRLNSGEVIPYFEDLHDPAMEICTFMFHTRFSTNTDPATFMAQPFRRMAHNGELNTDKKNRLSEDAIAKQQNKKVIFPKGQSDSARLDQTLQRRIIQDDMDIVTAVLAMMPPAWENTTDLPSDVRAMYEYFSLYEEKNDGPAALVFSDGRKVGARLDRLGLRPLRSVETEEYLCVMSEAGQIDFAPQDILKRGRIEAGGMICFDHEQGKVLTSGDIEKQLASEQDYKKLLQERSVHLKDLPPISLEEVEDNTHLDVNKRHVAYSMNQEDFRFLLDPMVESGMEKISAMGYGVALNALNADEGGMSKYFSQRFAQVTNPPLDSIREKDGMTLRVALGSKPNFSTSDSRQIVLDTPVLQRTQLEQIRVQKEVSCTTLDILYTPSRQKDENEKNLESALEQLLAGVEHAAEKKTGIIILSDLQVCKEQAAIPLLLAVAAANQRLIETGMRFNSSLVLETGQSASSHDVATALGFGASAICPITVHERAKLLMPQDIQKGLDNYTSAIGKSLMKIMGKFGLCTVESYIGGEIFESNYINTKDPKLAKHFPNIYSPVGGADFAAIAASAADWHYHSEAIEQEADIPHLGLFKERQEGAGHTFGTVAVREYINMTEEEVLYSIDEELEDIWDRFDLEQDFPKMLPSLRNVKQQLGKSIRKESELIAVLEGLFQSNLPVHHAAMRSIIAVLGKTLEKDRDTSVSDNYASDIDEILANAPHDPEDPLGNLAYKQFGFRRLSPEEINTHRITESYRQFVQNVYTERKTRPAALRDIMYFPADINKANNKARFLSTLSAQSLKGNNNYKIKGLLVEEQSKNTFKVTLEDISGDRVQWLSEYFDTRFGNKVSVDQSGDALVVQSEDEEALFYLNNIITANKSIDKSEVQPACEITPTLSSAAMSHGALVAEAHEAVSQGANIAGALSNSGEGGEKRTRYNTTKASSIKQVASGRFGVWAGYFADPSLEQVEIKIAQGAKPGEGGQLPSHKVSVVIASSRGGTPRIELVSPPPHHDTYSIEDLGQLIHDCKASRAKVIVKLVSSEGIGTIAVGVAKAGADVINVAGNTGGTGAAAVTSLKNTGRSAEIGIAEVHQALSANGIREKVILRASNAHQTGIDVIKSAVLGADSFEFGTTALMMLKCVMAKNCNIKCPAGITTNAELFQGDARALAQYFLNVAHEVRELLAYLGYKNLSEIRGKTELLHLIHHDRIIGQLDYRALLGQAEELKVEKPIYVEANFNIDDKVLSRFEKEVLYGKKRSMTVESVKELKLNNTHKSVGAQLSIDIERILNHRFTDADAKRAPAVLTLDTGRRFLAPETLKIHTTGSAGQSYGAFLNNGLVMKHLGTCNDGVGKAQSGGTITVSSPGGGSIKSGENVLIGNFALFGASGGRLFVNGEAGDRFAVRNSGALAVVEGVGDFCCEYMTSGAVLNLRAFGKGFGNGMSGGNAYQYDPENKLEQKYNKESVRLGRLDTGSYEAETHEQILLDMLQQHVEATNSKIAITILENWDEHKKHFWFATPLALYETQTAERLAKNTSRKEQIEELAQTYTYRQLNQIRMAYETGDKLLQGRVPAIGETDTMLIFRLIIRYSIFLKASELAHQKAKQYNIQIHPENLSKYVKNIILTEDKNLMDYLVKNAKDVWSEMDDTLLTHSLANKRVNDYKEALSNRDTLENNSPGSMAWILQQDQENLEAKKARIQFVKECASKISTGVVKNAFDSESQLTVVPTDTPLSEGQMQWLNGYFHGLTFGLSTAGVEEEGGKPLLIAYGTQTGNAEGLAADCAEMALAHELSAEVVDMANLTPEMIAGTERLVIITSTYGEGEHPDNALNIWKQMSEDGAPALSGLNYSICAIGDSSYDLFCQAGIDWDKRLAELGANRVQDMVQCDVDYEEPFEAWAHVALPALSLVGDQTVTATTSKGSKKPAKKESLYGKKNPFPAKLKKKQVLTSSDSSKEVVHYEIDLAGSEYSYEAGDVLQVYPTNAPELVEDILKAVQASGEEEITSSDGAVKSLREALLRDYEIKTPSKALLQAVAANANNKELASLVQDESKKGDLQDFLWGRDSIDLLTHYEHGLNAISLVDTLTKLAPRAYSISSSFYKHPDEVHLTVGSVRYESHGKERKGVASTWLADLVQEGETDIRCYLHHNKAFAIPEDHEKPMIMVGPGTGIAPFRAFLEEREYYQAKGKNWLFFGERNSATDYYYQEQLAELSQNGYLSKLSLAFSRDQEEKIYVQDRMREEGAELFQWLEEGGYFFVCGDAYRMAKDVDKTLHEVIAEHGNMSPEEAEAYVNTLKAEKRYVRDVY
jgi:glutamate synthase (NADPH/NADH) large chain